MPRTPEERDALIPRVLPDDLQREIADGDRLEAEGWQEQPLGPISEMTILQQNLEGMDEVTLSRIARQNPREDVRTAAEAEIRRRLGPLGDKRFGARQLSEIPDDPPEPLLLDRLDPTGHTILYGTGGAGKGVLAAHYIVDLVAGDGHRVLILDYENHPGEWARRIGSLGGADVLARVTWAGPLAAGWTAQRGPLWVAQYDLRELAKQVDASYIVTDSIVAACVGTDPTKPEAASMYTAALQTIEVPMLSLAHVTKENGLAYPFGSVFWHNFARMTWSLEREGEAAILTNRKHNNYAGQGRVLVTSTWTDDRLREVAERSYSAVLSDRLHDILAGDPGLTVAEIVDRLTEDDDESIKPDSIRKALRRGIKTTPQRFTVRGTAEAAQWSLA